MTEYVILQLLDSGHWSEQGKTEASSPIRALRSHVRSGAEGEYVAVPSRSWKPLTVKVEQTTKVTIS